MFCFAVSPKFLILKRETKEEIGW